LIAVLPADLQARIEREIHTALAIAWRRHMHNTDDGADRVASLISAETLARMLTARAAAQE
jgi:hypothetical protein